MRSLAFAISFLAAVSLGCIEKSGSAIDSENEESQAGSDASSSGTTDGSTNMGPDGAGSDAAIPPPPPIQDGGGAPAEDAATPIDDPPPPPAEADACERFCSRMEMCLFPACEGLEDLVGPDFCGGWCREASDDFLNESADLTCEGFVERIYSFADELEEFCSDDEPIPDECETICEFAGECGFESAGCSRLCRSLGPEQRRCMLAADECGEFFGCIEDERDNRPDVEEICGNYCQRSAVCIFNECAPGTLPDDYTRGCFEGCVENPPEGRELQRFFNQTCEEVVVAIRDRDELINSRCDAEEEEACQTLCEDRVVPCMGIDQASCLQECRGWDEANHVCLVRSDSCREINECFGDPEGQERCRRSCDVLQACMEEACPPRILPPTLTDGCTADCLNDPPSQPELEQWEALSCREVREVIYRGNRELRPFCEGGRDFRPTPDECVAFCDNALGACLGIGGRNFCLAGCSSLTRDQYGCALEAQGNCDEINRCLNDEAEQP